jgi:hypothetical protein
VAYYPQLTTGAVAQFPAARVVRMRTVVNQLLSGYTIRMEDSGAQQVEWALQYAGLTNTERTSIENLFESVEGQLNTFTFLDPTANLLMWSEAWTQSVWTADPLLQVAGGVEDPTGGGGGVQLTNAAEAPQQIVQTIGGPSNFVYSYSVYVKSSVPTTIQLVVQATGQTVLTPITAGGAWSRVMTRAGLSVQQDEIGFGVQIPAGAQVDVFGAQVEAQPEAGLYKKTIDLGGVYGSTRFSSDVLNFTASAVNQNSCQLGLISQLN